MARAEEKCGLCVAQTLHDAYSFIKSLQHRGREAAGIACKGPGRLDVLRWVGPINRFDLGDLHRIFPGYLYNTFIAHVRYATSADKSRLLYEAHPHVLGGRVQDNGSHLFISNCDLAIVHNGQINPPYLEELDDSCDTRALLWYYRKHGEYKLLQDIPGAYTAAIADKNTPEIIALRDPTGIKPGALGLKDGRYCIASEDVAFKQNGGQFEEDLKPGSVYYLSAYGSVRRTEVSSRLHAFCFFEYNYIGSPHSIMNGLSVRRVRELLGDACAEEFVPPDADYVTYLPRCPEQAARRYAKRARIPFLEVFYKMSGERSFMGSTAGERQNSIRSNLHLLPNIEEKLQGKTVILMDDSLIRGNNALEARRLLEEAGAAKVYLLLYTPPIGITGSDGRVRGCSYGVDMPPEDTFLARNARRGEISKRLGMRVYYLSREAHLKVYETIGMPRKELCTYCIGGRRPFQ